MYKKIWVSVQGYEVGQSLSNDNGVDSLLYGHLVEMMFPFKYITL